MISNISKTVLVTGANGYIGRAVAVAFRQQGYTVYGVVRSNEKAQQARLADEEIIPVIANPENVESYKEYVAKAGIIIENASHDEKAEIIKNLVPLVSKSGLCEDNSKKMYIQTVGYRQWPHEHLILQSKDIIGSVVRPAFAYGGKGGPVQKAYLFNKPPQGQKLKTFFSKDVLPWVQINDLARAYLLIAENKNKVQGQLFRVGVWNKNITYDNVVKAHAQVMGVELEIIPQAEHGIEKLIAFLAPQLADYDTTSTTEILGWKPKFSCNPLDDLDLQYQCYLSWWGKK